MKSKIFPTIRAVTATLILSTWAAASGQSIKVDDERYHWEGVFFAGLNNDGYELGAGVGYFINQFAGVKATVGWATEFGGLEYVSWDADEGISFDPPDYMWGERRDDRAIRFKFTPSLVFRTPCLINWKSQDAGFYLFAEPGLVMASPAKATRNARWLTADLKAGINLQIDRWVVTLGYGVSNFSLLSGRQYSDGTKDNYITHTVFVGSAYKF